MGPWKNGRSRVGSTGPGQHKGQHDYVCTRDKEGAVGS